MASSSQFSTLPNVKVTESSRLCSIEADISSYGAAEISVRADHDGLIVEMVSRHQPHQSYYLGELETERVVRAIPLTFSPHGPSLESSFDSGTLQICVEKLQEKTASAA